MAKIKKLIRSYLSRLRLGKTRKAIIKADHALSGKASLNYERYERIGFSPYESELYGFPKNDYHNFITTWESYQPRLRQNEYDVISDDKYLFALVFGKFVETPITYGLVSKGCFEPILMDVSEDNLYSFLVSQGGGVIKNRCGCDGYGVCVLKAHNGKLLYLGSEISPSDLKSIIAKFEKGIVQSRLTQGSYGESLFDETINTIRMITIRKPGSIEHEVVCATQRIGSKRSIPVDNFSQGGYSAIINLETGELGAITSFHSKDSDLNQVFYDAHPDTGIIIKGKKVPNWEEIKKCIVDLSRKLPFFEYVAWDIVVKDEGISVIETNMKSSLGNIQVHGGLRHASLGQAYKRMGYLVDDKHFSK